jgi:zinc D-Ala-D-Ala dipeptidase
MISDCYRRCVFMSGLFLTVAAIWATWLHATVMEPTALQQSTQMIVVTTPGWNAVEGSLQAYERRTPHEMWRPVGRPIAIVVGVHGMGWGLGVVATDDSRIRNANDPVKKEGDGKSPAGVFGLGPAFGLATQPMPGLKLRYLPLTASIECVDDAGSKFYNRLVNRFSVAADWHSSEHMRDVGKAYRWGVVVDHNGGGELAQSAPPVPGAGSCVFLHIWGGPTHGTAGCTAMAPTHLETLLSWLDPARKPLLVQLPESTYERVKEPWRLPEVATSTQ